MEIKLDNLGQYIRECFKKNDNEPFLIYNSSIYTYAQVNERVQKEVELFKLNGIRSNDIVTISFKENSFEFIYCFLAALFIDAKCCIVPVALQELQYRNKLTKWTISDCEMCEEENLLCVDNNVYKIYKSSIHKQLPKDFQETRLILPTSGTTGEPKWIFLSDNGLIETVLAIKKYMKTDSSDVFFALKHLAHVSSITSDLLLAIFSGGKLTVNTSAFNLQGILAQINRDKVTVLTLVPTILHYLVSSKTKKYLKSVKSISLVGAPASKELILKVKEVIPETKIYIGYGLTEVSSRLTYLDPLMLDEKIESIGVPIDNATIKLVNEGKDIVEPYCIGEIVAKSSGIMLGYMINNEFVKQTEKILPTNDLAYFDEDLFFYHCGRKDDIMIINGNNVSPIQIEKKVQLLDEIRSCLAFKDKNQHKYDSIVLLVELNEDVVSSEIDIYNKIKELLPASLLPKKILILDEIPRTPNGKISRKLIADKFSKGGETV